MKPRTKGRRARHEDVAQVRRQHILDAAQRVFSSQGYESATMEQIARQADYTKRTVYAYFKSKEALLLEVCAAALERMVPVLVRESARARLGADKLSRIGTASLHFFKNDPVALAAFGQTPAFTRPHLALPAFRRVKLLNAEVHRLIAGAFAAGIVDGSVRAGIDPPRAALFVTTATAALMQSVWRRGAVFEKLNDVLSEEFLQFCMQMIGASFLAPSRERGQTRPRRGPSTKSEEGLPDERKTRPRAN